MRNRQRSKCIRFDGICIQKVVKIRWGEISGFKGNKTHKNITNRFKKLLKSSLLLAETQKLTCSATLSTDSSYYLKLIIIIIHFADLIQCKY